ncbi:MAG: N-acetyltransferase [Elusimicrobia bacterium]|nr:N-acetyltransferase [Elusimicrobiota bacterium]
MEIIIRSELPAERGASDEILRKAYGGDAEANLASALRAASEFNANLSLVAANGSEILGYALYTRVMVTGSSIMPAAALSVMAVREDRRKLGVAERLVRHGLERCRGLKIDLVFASAIPAYFARIGFRPAAPNIKPNWDLSPDQFSVFDLSGSHLAKLTGVVTYPASYHAR